MRDLEVWAGQGSASYISFLVLFTGAPDKRALPGLLPCSLHSVSHHELPEVALCPHGNAHSKSLQVSTEQWT